MRARSNHLRADPEGYGITTGGGGEKTSETRIGWKIRISFGESLSTRVVPSRGRVRGNPIRQADVN